MKAEHRPKRYPSAEAADARMAGMKICKGRRCYRLEVWNPATERAEFEVLRTSTASGVLYLCRDGRWRQSPNLD